MLQLHALEVSDRQKGGRMACGLLHVARTLLGMWVLSLFPKTS